MLHAYCTILRLVIEVGELVERGNELIRVIPIWNWQCLIAMEKVIDGDSYHGEPTAVVGKDVLRVS